MKPRICVVVAAEITIRAFLINHLRALEDVYDVEVVVNTTNPDFLREFGLRARVHPMLIERKISPGRDLSALVRLYQLFRQGRFDLVHSVTPKAGLLAMLAARLAGIPIRVHTFTGQVWATRTGAARSLLKMLDRFLAVNATSVLVDSPSQRDFLLEQGVIRVSNSSVLASGSISGVRLEQFQPDPLVRQTMRETLDIPMNDEVLLFLGRLNRDKGILDLAGAFNRLAENHPNLHLLIVGPDEENLISEVRAHLDYGKDRLHVVGFTTRPQDYMNAADVFCLPSYREGFGSVIIEAAGVGIPSVGSRIYGVTDAILDGVTGLLHTSGDENDIVRVLKVLLLDPLRRLEMGQQARSRAIQEFTQERVTTALLEHYAKILKP